MASEVRTGNPNTAWRNYTKRVWMDACKLSTGVAASTTTIQIKGFNAEIVTGSGEDFFDSPLLPERMSSIEYDPIFRLKTQFNFTPKETASVLLDFTRPSIFDQGMPSEPTPNQSNWFVIGESEAWCTSLSARLEQFFSERKTGLGWLHRPHAYDWLLIVIGMPLALWGANRIGNPIFRRLHLAPSSVLETAMYVYAFFLCLNGFRWMFSYARWVFPKVELMSEKSSSGKHRALWAALTIGMLGSALWDAIKALM